MTDQLIKRLNVLLSKNPLMDDILYTSSSFAARPIIFIVGLPRSGTTPLVQVLIRRFKLGYVTNLVARFWEAPEIGITLAKEVSNDPGAISPPLESFYGFTSGYEGHHEFGYFWQRWFKFKEIHYLDAVDQLEVDVNGLRKQLLLMDNVWQRPLIFKNAAALPLQTKFLGKIFENSLFIHIERDHVDIAASLLEGRKKYNNNINKWFSIKPKEYAFLKHRNIFEQVSGQVYYTNREIINQIESIPSHRKHHLRYDKLCENTEYELERIESFFNSNNLDIQKRDINLQKLDTSKINRYDEETICRIKTIIERFQNGTK